MASVTNYNGDRCEVAWGTYQDKHSFRCYLRANITPTCSIHETLGWITKKNDGRFTWHLVNTNTFFKLENAKESPLQGVEPTLEAAQQLIERRWKVNV